MAGVSVITRICARFISQDFISNSSIDFPELNKSGSHITSLELIKTGEHLDGSVLKYKENISE